MANKFKSPPALVISQSPMVDKNTGMATRAFLNLFLTMYTSLSNSINSLGELIGDISAEAVITGRTEGIGTTVGNINAGGVITPPGLIPATDAAQGAVVLPSGASSNTLGSAALASATAFDPAGAAAAAQANAEAHANTVAATAQSNAQTFASNASNLSSGTVAFGRLPGITGTVTLAALTVGGTNGSLTFSNGVITAKVDPT
jgi:hypothetical protein